jgi:NADH-quinone oxidoreductase subunit M
LFNFTLSAAALMLVAGSLQQRLASTELMHMGGLAAVLPRLALLCFLFALASLGAPLSGGFPAELLLLIGNFKAHPGLGITALCGAVLGAAALLHYLRRALWGPLREPRNRHLQDLLPREYLLFLVFALLILLSGIFPQFILDLTGPATAALLAR